MPVNNAFYFSEPGLLHKIKHSVSIVFKNLLLLIVDVSSISAYFQTIFMERKMLKKAMIILASLLVVVSLTACQDQGSSSNSDQNAATSAPADQNGNSNDASSADQGNGNQN